jgi:hypothetical protein
MIPLSKYFRISAVFPWLITVVAGIILAITHDGSNYKSEWFTDDGFVFTVVLTILLSGLITLFSTTIFLNSQKNIRNNAFLSFIAWILLPGALCFFPISEEIENFTRASDGAYEGDITDVYIFSTAVLHLVFLIIGYILFRKRLKQGIV